MRVLALTVRADIGGGPEHLYQLTQAFGTAVDTIIACPSEPPYFDRYLALPNVSRVLHLPHRAFQVSALRELATAAHLEDVSLIHSHGKGAGLYGRFLAAWTGIPCVHTFHGWHIGDYGALKRRAYLALEKTLGKFTRAAICVSEGEAEVIRAAGIIPDNIIRVIENGVYLPRVPRNGLRSTEKLKIVAVSRYDFQKNPELIISTARALVEKIGDTFELTVLGDGERRFSIQKDISEEGLDGVIKIMGAHTAPREVFRESDVFFSTSRWEGMPIAVLEAMSEGLPVVASDVIGNRDVVSDGKTGFLFPSDDATSASLALERLAKDRFLQHKLGEQGRKVVRERFSVERMAERTLGVYAQVGKEDVKFFQ